MKKLLITAAIGATAIGGIAIAAQTATPTPPAPRGDVTRADYVAHAGARFDKLDTNRDGTLTRDERRAGFKAMRAGHPGGAMGMQRRGGMAGRMMAQLDTDGDGKISRAENDTQATERFQKLDTNNDGRIDATERQAAGNGGRGAGMMARMLDRLDSDGDGAITRAEYDAATKARFDRLDANGDGFIDASERDAAMSRMGRGGGQRGGDTPPPPPPGN